jgi:ribosomal-protein-alanine N-acetyltransferase
MKITVTEEICLTEIRREDKPAFVEHFKEREIADNLLMVPYPYTEADADTFLKIVEESLRKHGRPVNLAIRAADDHLIGGVGFKELEANKSLPHSHRAEIGYWLARPYWGRGIATAAVRAACAYAFAELGLEKITAHVFARNIGSARVLEKAGFQKEGHLHRHYRKKGQFLDAWLYGLLK